MASSRNLVSTIGASLDRDGYFFKLKKIDQINKREKFTPKNLRINKNKSFTTQKRCLPLSEVYSSRPVSFNETLRLNRQWHRHKYREQVSVFIFIGNGRLMQSTEQTDKSGNIFGKIWGTCFKHFNISTLYKVWKHLKNFEVTVLNISIEAYCRSFWKHLQK